MPREPGSSSSRGPAVRGGRHGQRTVNGAVFPVWSCWETALAPTARRKPAACGASPGRTLARVPVAASLTRTRDGAPSGSPWVWKHGDSAELTTCYTTRRAHRTRHSPVLLTAGPRPRLRKSQVVTAGDTGLPFPEGRSSGPQPSESILKITFPGWSCPPSQGAVGPTRNARGSRQSLQDPTAETQATPSGFKVTPATLFRLFSSGTPP